MIRPQAARRAARRGRAASSTACGRAAAVLLATVHGKVGSEFET